jgi:hypothetical protein
VKQPEESRVETVIRRRPTRRHRQNRRIRSVLLTVFCAGLVFGIASSTLRFLSPSLFHSSRSEPDRQSVEASRNLLLLTQQESLRQMGDRPVYPYSVVPGGVKDAQELKWAAQHDPVVAAHYAGFDYDHARVVRLVLARTAYVSYRIGNKVYWTRKRVKLKKGETVITDGKMTARTRCANRVEEVPLAATSRAEPPVSAMEAPILPAGTAMSNPPLPFESALLTRPTTPGVGPSLPLSLYDPLTNGSWTPIMPPPLPGVCGIGKNKNGSTGGGTKGKGNPCAPNSGGVVPEPGTWLLMASGLAAIYLGSRKRLKRI